ncbi:formylglycine-generating enzyme [Gammaproteobacteria bacterium]
MQSNLIMRIFVGMAVLFFLISQVWGRDCPSVCPDGSRPYFCICPVAEDSRPPPVVTPVTPKARPQGRNTDCNASRMPSGGGSDCPPSQPPTLPSTVEAGSSNQFAGIEFVWIPSGCFNMGSPDSEEDRGSDEGPVHRVCVDGFWMGKYEVTQGQWKKIMGNNPATIKKDDDYPVENVSWDDAQAYIRQLNMKGVGHFRLPTEAEWEYAARAGTTTPFYFGNTIDSDTQVNYDGNDPYGNGAKGQFRQFTTSVGNFPPNDFGLHDMHGNVWEWVEDWYCKNFYGLTEARNKNPLCNNHASGFRVVRGGSWVGGARYARSANRIRITPDNRGFSNGFRLARLAQD